MYLITGNDAKSTFFKAGTLVFSPPKCHNDEEISQNESHFSLRTNRGRGWRNGLRITNTGTSKSTMMVSPSGFSISVSEHLRNDE